MPKENNWVDEAEKVIRDIKAQGRTKTGNDALLTTSQIRNILAMTAEIYNELRLCQGQGQDELLRERLNYLRVRCIYAAGRDEAVRLFVERSGILDKLTAVRTIKDFIGFNRYMEALVAWYKYLM